ncbi:MAG: hypothetical protein WC763_01610 [Candidatus Paceibacterota bacterium]
MLTETREIVEQNAVILRSLHKSKQFEIAFRVLYWFAIIALSLGSYYLIQPYVDTLKEVYTDVLK